MATPDEHDVFMISYLVATIPWTFGCIALGPKNPVSLKYRKIFAACFFGTIVPLVYFFIQHKVHRVAGAYTIYAFFEWSLVLFDVAFDAVTAVDFAGFDIIVKDVQGVSKGRAKPAKSTPLSETLDALANIYNGFAFWSMLTSLGLCIWYFPLWHMGLSGYEAFVMAPASPFLFIIPGVLPFVCNNQRFFHLLSVLLGLGAYLVPDPARRLTTVAAGVAVSCLAWVATLYNERSQPAKLESRVLGLGAGLLMSSIAKYAYRTNNPIWPIMHEENGGLNRLGLALAVLAVWRATRRTPRTGEFSATGKSNKKGSALFAAFGVGGLFFGLHSLLSDSSTMIQWVWEGFPVRGPIAVPHGALTLLAMGLGLLAGVKYPRCAGSYPSLLLAACGAYLVTMHKHWLGFAGALTLAVYLMAVAPVLLSSAIKHNPAFTFGLGFLVYNLMVLAHVWLVAYAFVPGGPLLREHTDYVMTAMVVQLAAGVVSARTTNARPVIKINAKKEKEGASSATKARPFYVYALAALEVLALVITYLRFPRNDYVPYHAEDKVLTAGIWTVHFSLDNDMWSSEVRMRDALRDLELDVFGLLETDTQRIIMGNRDTSQYLAEELGMYVDPGPGPNKHTWGCVLLSKFPIVNSTHHLLPSPVGELAPAIHATLDVYGELVDVVVFHSGQEEDVEDRRLQTEYLSHVMAGSPRPLILLSYLVTKPHQGNYNTHVSEYTRMNDIDPSDWDRWCQYILYRGIRRVGYARVSRGTITDTEIQVGKFVVDGKNTESSNEMISEADVAPGLRFPELFRGNGVRGHRYHVFDEPRYFA
ncbi:hypothetical protein KEM52_006412 [Ascosphaera acerosa]|nr:hypothetical protein KEM52_006412 [Ascosphaera acerosa]